MHVARPVRRLALAGALLAAVTLTGLAHSGTASAALACRSDPVIVVNGAVADIVSTLYTDSASNVRELDYTITIPTGSLIGKTSLTVGLGFPEKVTYVFSPTQPKGTMSIAASVVTAPGVAPFATSVQVTTLLDGIHTASGYSNETVGVTLGHLLML